MTYRTSTACKALMAGLVAATIGSAIPASSAEAAQSATFTVAPTNARHATALRTGLGLYAWYRGARSGAIISQTGTDNRAGLAQHGQGNLGILHQQGSGHAAILQQSGDGNSYGLFQFGRKTDGHVVQSGSGGAGATIQFGW